MASARAALLLLCALGACRPAPGPADAGVDPSVPVELEEAEPNGRAEQAQRLERAARVSASLLADPKAADEDWYALVSDREQSVELSVSGIPGLDIAFQLLDDARTPLLTVNSAGEGEPERLPAIRLRGQLLLRVYSVKRGSGGAYTLSVGFHEPRPGFEAEPNDRAVDANALPLGESISGFVGHAGDEDWYRFELPDAPEASEPQRPEPPQPGTKPPPPEGGQVAAGETPLDPEGPSWALRVTLSPLAMVRPELRVLSAAEAPLFEIRGKEGEALLLRNIGVRARDRVVYVVVRSAWSGTGKDGRRGYDPDAPYTLTVELEEAGANAELESNDTPIRATPLAVDGFREGFLAPEGDVDYFVVRPPEPVLLSFELTGVERVDHELSVVQPGEGGAAEEVLLRANDGDLKEPELLNHVMCVDACYLKVRSAARKVDGKWTRDSANPDVPYLLRVRAVQNPGVFEREPNDKAAWATPIALGRPARGTVHPRRDVDYFRLDLSGRPIRTTLQATLLGILKVDVGLYVHRLEEDGTLSLVQTADQAKGEAPETIRYSAEPGLYLFEVRDSRNREANFQDPYQLTVEEER